MYSSGTLRRPVYGLYRLAWIGLDWLYPPMCGGCGQPGSRWCERCTDVTRQIKPPVCHLCGQPLNEDKECSTCKDTPLGYNALRSWAYYSGPLREAIHRLKYKGDMALGEALSQPLVELLGKLSWPVDLVVPVPIGRARRKDRGYNQAALLAFPLALSNGLQYQTRALTKQRETLSQVELDPVQRRLNVIGAFKADKKLIDGKNVLIVDDVTTTGATLDACSKALFDAGASTVYGITLARAGLSQDPV